MDFDEIDKYMFQRKVQNNNIISTEKFFINHAFKRKKSEIPFLFISFQPLELFLFLRYLNFFPELFAYVGNFNKVNFNLKVNFKTYDVTN